MTPEQIQLKKAGSTPAHAYLKYLYNYPEATYPYLSLIDTNHDNAAAGPLSAS
jgi:hypothetical protein